MNPSNQIPKENNIYFLRRFAAFIIDFSIIYGVAFILYNIFQVFYIYISIVNLVLITALVYFPVTTIIFKASLGKVLTRLRVVKHGKLNYNLSIILREITYKQLFVIVLVNMLVNVYDLKWLSPYIEILIVFAISLLLFMFFIFTKKVWYDQLAGTSVVANNVNYLNYIKKAVFVLMIVGVLTFGIRSFFYLTTDSFNVPYIPKHSEKTVAPYVNFLNKQQSAKDYIFELFKKNDIVVLCEGMHPEMTQYDFIFDLVSDKRFVEEIGYVYSEVGSSSLQKELDNLMRNNKISDDAFDKKLLGILRNYSHNPIWDLTNFSKYLKNLYHLNRSLPSDKVVRHIFTDIEIDWASIKNERDYREKVKSKFIHRDKIMADNIIRNYESVIYSHHNRRKCLVIMNSRHAFGIAADNITDIEASCASYLMKKYPGKVANVLLNTVKMSFGLSFPGIPPFVYPVQVTPINNGIWDNAFSETENRTIGFNFSDSPFGRDRFDLFILPKLKRFRYKDIFTGFIYYKPIEEHYFSHGFKDIISDGFDNEIISRANRIKDNDIDNNLKWWTFKVDMLRKQDITIDRSPYEKLNSVFELLFGNILLVFGVLLGLIRFLKVRKYAI